MIIRLVLAAAIAAPCVGCASVTRGTTENISISSTPAGATAEIPGLDIPTACVTPCVVVAKRSADITVTVNKEGYEPQIIPLTKEIPGTGAAGFAGNVLLGGLVGMGVDAATGAALDHKPNPVIVTLQPVAPHGPPSRGRQDGRRRRRADRIAPGRPDTGLGHRVLVASLRVMAARRRPGPGWPPEITAGARLCDLKSRKGLAYLSQALNQ